MAAATAAANGGEQPPPAAAAAAPEPPPTPATTEANARPPLDPRLLMAARSGNSTLLQKLLRLRVRAAATAADGDMAVPVVTEADQVQVVIQLADLPAAAAAAPLPVPAENGVVTIDGASLLDVVATDGQEKEKHTRDMLSMAAARDDRVVDAVDPQPPPPPPAAAADDNIQGAVAPVATAALLDVDGVTIEGDSLLHVVAACGYSGEIVRCVGIIVGHKQQKSGASAERLALQARNNDGDTPLHSAAAAGNAYMVKLLLDIAGLLRNTSTTNDQEAAAAAAALKKAYVRLQNGRGETALHHAVKWASTTRAVDDTCIRRLVTVDSELAAVVTNDGTSPLYLAISLGEMDIAHYLLGTAKQEGNNLSYYSGPGGQNILHAAVSCGDVQALRRVLEWLGEGPKSGEEVPEQQQQQVAAAASARLLKQLTSQGDEENGSTPLHLAASLLGFPSTFLLPMWSWVRSVSLATSLLLHSNESTAYQPDKQGLYPIHVAAGTAGNLSVVDALLRRCPDCATLRDAEGRTFLHVAAEKWRSNVVRYACEQRRRRWWTWWLWRLALPPPAAAAGLSSILNAQDKNGDTPLHRAVHAGNLAAFTRLFRHPHVRLDVRNNKGMRPIDVSWSTMPLWAYYSWNPRIHIRSLLLKVAVPCGESRGDLFREKLARINPEFKGREENISVNLTAAAQVMGIFSALVTTVTFASAFTLPGGYRSAGDGGGGGGGVAGTPVLAGTYAFEAFVLADALAFICSFLATSLLLYAGVPAFSLDARFTNVNLAYGLMMNSGRSLVAALGLGIYVVLIPVARTIPIAIAVWMTMLAGVFIKASEGIDYMFNYPVIARRRVPSVWDVMTGWIVFGLQHFWSYILIFGIPAIREWAKAR